MKGSGKKRNGGNGQVKRGDKQKMAMFSGKKLTKKSEDQVSNGI